MPWNSDAAGYVAPPPPGAFGGSRHASAAAPRTDGRAARAGASDPAAELKAFSAEIDVCEIDDRQRPLTPWNGRTVGLNRSQLSFLSRRMCYADRVLLVMVHKIDDAPVPLLGKVRSCEYDADGMYRVVIDLVPVPEQGPIRSWIISRSR